MNETLGSFDDFLMESGLKKAFKDESSFDTRLYHDLNIYGDIAESYIELLRDKYDVDVSAFNFDSYFPQEFTGHTITQRVIFWLFPFLREKYQKSQDYLPFTFKKLKDAIDSKNLV